MATLIIEESGILELIEIVNHLQIMFHPRYMGNRKN